MAKLPDDFPIESWYDKSAAEQQKIISRTDLTRQEQWAILNSGPAIDTIALIQDIEANRWFYGLTRREANDITAKLWEIGNLRTGARNHDIPSLHGGAANARFIADLDRQQAELLDTFGYLGREEKAWYDKNGKAPAATPWPQPGPAPVTTPKPQQGTYQGSVGTAGPTPYPEGVAPVPHVSDYRFDTPDEALRLWANQYRSLSKEYEYCTGVMRVIEDGKASFYVTNTYRGSKGLDPEKHPKLANHFRANVVSPIVRTIIESSILPGELIGFAHTHPDASYDCTGFSEEDKMIVDKLRFEAMWLAPYQNNKVYSWPEGYKGTP